jgi:hypothetical protein
MIDCAQSDGSCWMTVAGVATWILLGFVVGLILGIRVPRRSIRRSTPAATGGSNIPGTGIEIYAGNLAYDLTEDDLREAFGKYGTVSDVRIITNKFNNKSKGYGFVRMPEQAEADEAIKALHGKNLKGREIVANEAKSKSKHNER